MTKILRLMIGLTAMVLFGAGCSTYTDQTAALKAAWRNGEPQVAARKFGSKADKAAKRDAIIWHLEAGAAFRAVNDYTNSLRHLNAAAAVIDQYEQEAKVKVGHEAAAILSNQQNLPYEGKSYDKIMLHTYAALDYLSLGDIDKARPEIIRAYQRQQDAVADNARRIQKAKEEEAQSKDRDAIERARRDPTFAAAVNDATKNCEGFKFYADYVNPFTVYLDGLYFLHAGGGGSDLERAIKSLNRVMEVTGGNKFVQQDLVTATNALRGQAPAACTYVIFETGCAASLGEIRIDIPIIVTKVSYLGAAFPVLEFDENYAPSLGIKAGDLHEMTLPLASMDSMVALDYKNEFPTILTKTLIATITKGVAAYAVNEVANEQNNVVGILAQIGTAVAQMAVNIADTRSWTTLPKEFQVARIPTPADRKLTLSTPGSAPQQVNLLDGAVNVVYAKSITATGPLLVSQFKLK